MSGLAEQAIRLRRTNWKSAQLLAEEMYLILLQDPSVTSGPINVTMGAGAGNPAINADGIQFPTLSLPPFTNSQDTTPQTDVGAGLDQLPFGDFPTFSLPPLDQLPTLNIPDLNLPGFDLADPAFNNPDNIQQSEQPNADEGQITRKTSRDQWLRITVPGKVLKKTGDLYTMQLYPNGQSDAPVTVAGVVKLAGPDVDVDSWVPAVFRATLVRTTRISQVQQSNGQESAVSTQVEIVARTHEFVAPSAGGGGGVPGVLLDGGPGDTYNVNLYPNGRDKDPVKVVAKQLQIDPGATLPPETWAFFSFVGGEWLFQAPVWL